MKANFKKQANSANKDSPKVIEDSASSTFKGTSAIKPNLISSQVKTKPLIDEGVFAGSSNNPTTPAAAAKPAKAVKFAGPRSHLLGLLSVAGLLVLATVGLVIAYNAYRKSFQDIQKSRVSTNIDTTSVDLAGIDSTSTGIQGIGVLQVNGDATITGGITANTFNGSGADLTNLNADNITSGTLSDARLSGNVALLDATQTFTGNNTFAGQVALPGVLVINSLSYNMPGTQAAGSLVNDGSGNLVWAPASACPTCIVNNGNAFGAAVVIGSTNVQNLQLITSGITRLTFDTTGNATFNGPIRRDYGTYIDEVAMLNLDNQTFEGDNQLFRNVNNSTTAFVVQRANSTPLLTVDTLNAKLIAPTIESNSITPTAAMTVGSTSQTLTLNGGASSTWAINGGGFSTMVGFNGTPTGNVMYFFDRTAAGSLTPTPTSYAICTSAGNCGGGGGITGGGTAGSIAKFTGPSGVGDSLLSETGSQITVNGTFKVLSASPDYMTLNSYGLAIYDDSAGPTGTTTNYLFPAAGNNTYDVCTSSGNCFGSGGVGANTALSNLDSATMAISTSLLPGSVNLIDLGSTAKPFRDIYIGDAATDNFKLTGTATGARTITFPNYTGTVCTTDGTTTAQVCYGYANNTLSNLGTVELNQSLLPKASSLGSISLGNTSLPFSELWLSGGALSNWGTNRFKITGLSSGLTVLQLPTVTAGTYTFCLDQSVNNCGYAPSSGSGVYFAQGGNSFTNTATLGTIDSYSLVFKTSNQPAMTIASGGAITLQNFTNSTSAFMVLNSAGSSTAFNVDTTNSRVGIGTIAPSSDLSFGEAVIRSIGVETRSTNSNGGNLTISAGNAGSGASARSGGLLALRWGGGVNSGAAGYVSIRDSSDQEYFRFTQDSSAGSFGTMYCGVFLSNNCALRSGSNLALVANNDRAVYVRNISNSTSAFRVESSSAGNAAIFNVDTTNSRVGIGTASPSANLEIASSAAAAVGPIIRLTNSGGTSVNTGAGIDFFGSDNNRRGRLQFQIETGGASSMIFSNGVGSMTQMFKVDGNSSSRGQVTVVGGLATDIQTVVTSGAAASLTLQPGLSTGASSNGGATIIYGGNASGTTSVTGGALTLQGGSATGASGTRNGGSVTIDAGTGASANGSITIGGTNAAAISIGSATGALTVVGNANLNGNTTIGNLTSDKLTVTSQILGASPLVFQGATDDSFTTTFGITDPTASKTITFPNETGTVCTTAAAGVCSTSATGYFQNGGNNFSGTATLGTTDSSNLVFRTGNTDRWVLDTSGNLYPNVDDTYNIGSDTNRVANLYLGPETLHIGTSTTDEGTLGYTTSTNVFSISNQATSTNNGVLIKNAADSTTAFQVQNAAGTSDILTVDSTSQLIALGKAGTLTGKITFFGSTSGSIALQGPSTGGGNTITLPNETGTVCTSAASSTSICTNFAAASALAGYATTTLNNLGTTAISADLSFASGSARVIKNTSGNLTISTNTSGILALTSVGALNLTGAAASTWQTSAGALTITAGAASTWSSSSGALTITSAAAATWGTTTGALTIGPADLSTLILRTNSSTRFTLANNASTLTGSGATSLVGGSTLTLNAAAASALNLGTTATTGSINIGTNITSGAITIGSTNSTSTTYIKSYIGGTTTFGRSTYDPYAQGYSVNATILLDPDYCGDPTGVAPSCFIGVENIEDPGTSLTIAAGGGMSSGSKAGGDLILSGGLGAVFNNAWGGDVYIQGGIGTDSSGVRDSYGNIYLNSSATTISTVGSAAADALTVINTASGSSLRVNDDGTSTDSSPFIIDAAGNVVIGKNTAASAKLDIVSSATTGTGTLLTASSVTTGNAFRLESNAITTGSGIIVNQLTGAARAAGGSLLNLRGGNQATGTGSNDNVIRIEDNNGLCIGNPGAAAMAFACVSDQSTKDNIVDADNVLADLSLIQVRAFDVKSDGSHVKYGVVAQELESTGLSWLVGVDENGLKTVRGLDPWLLTKGIQELNTKVDTMQSGLSTSVLAAIADANAITVNGTLTINGITLFNGDASFKGNVTYNSDYAGTATIAAGQTKVSVTYSKAMPKAPQATATPKDFITGPFRVTNETVNGFDIELQSTQASDTIFNWQATITD